MKMIRTTIPDVVLIEPTVFGDERGWFMESFNQNDFYHGLSALGLPLPPPFVQDNHSCSSKGVLRGLHYQVEPQAQGKLVRVVQGSAFDVVVDIRKDSTTYLEWFGVGLSSANNMMLWVPEGFAHGFVALEDNTQFLYKTTAYYDRCSERSLLWNDPDLGIVWPTLDNYIISSKDNEASTASSL